MDGWLLRNKNLDKKALNSKIRLPPAGDRLGVTELRRSDA